MAEAKRVRHTTTPLLVVPAILVHSPEDLTSLGPFKEGSWKVIGGVRWPFGQGDTVQLSDGAATRRKVVKIGGIVSWEKRWVKFVVREVGGSAEVFLYAPLDVIRLGVWEWFIHRCRSPWLSDTITGYPAIGRSLEMSGNRYAQPVGRAKSEGVSSLDLVEEGYGPYRVGMGVLGVQSEETFSLEVLEDGLHPCKVVSG